MEVKKLICVECPMGCNVEVVMEGSDIKDVTGFSCVRGKNYACLADAIELIKNRPAADLSLVRQVSWSALCEKLISIWNP
ncbi:MAG: hypothetical protein IKL77_02765 [Clostridia bacterium]|nr:hypothetical protein [Clostridia bacterium]